MTANFQNDVVPSLYFGDPDGIRMLDQRLNDILNKIFHDSRFRGNPSRERGRTVLLTDPDARAALLSTRRLSLIC